METHVHTLLSILLAISGILVEKVRARRRQTRYDRPCAMIAVRIAICLKRRENKKGNRSDESGVAVLLLFGHPNSSSSSSQPHTHTHTLRIAPQRTVIVLTSYSCLLSHTFALHHKVVSHRHRLAK
uniref:Putative secreted protein n=1 Tax=Anopheles darlingi TaxID=43151 RepID=A0A2M4DRJ6_ANODA